MNDSSDTPPQGEETRPRLSKELREARIIELRAQGLSNAEIAKEFGVTPESMAAYCSALIKAGKLERRSVGRPPLTAMIKLREFEVRIIEMRGQGLSNAEIANECGLKRVIVNQICSRLIRAGKLVRNRPGWGALKPEERLARESKIIEMRQRGISTAVIASELGISRGTVQEECHALANAGRLPPRTTRAKKPPTPRMSSIQRLDRETRIIELRGKGLSNSEIAKELDTTHGTINVLCSRLIKAEKLDRRHRRPNERSAEKLEREAQIIVLRGQGLTNVEIAKALDVKPGTMGVLCSNLVKAGKLEARKTFPRALEPAAIRARENRIIEMREQGLSNAEIAKEMGFTLQTINTLCSRLIKAGRLDRRREAVWRLMPADKRLEYEVGVIALSDMGMSLQEIAEVLGFPFSTTHHICTQLIKAGKLKKLPSEHANRLDP